MSRSQQVPTYRKHSSGQARVTLADAVTGRRKDVLLGCYGSKQSKVEYARVIAAWEAAGRRIANEIAPADLSVNELLLHFHEHAEAQPGRRRGRITNARKVRQQTAAAAYTDLLPAVAAMRDEGLSLRAIAARLNVEGHTTRRGRPWCPVRVARVLSRRPAVA